MGQALFKVLEIKQRTKQAKSLSLWCLHSIGRYRQPSGKWHKEKYNLLPQVSVECLDSESYIINLVI